MTPSPHHRAQVVRPPPVKDQPPSGPLVKGPGGAMDLVSGVKRGGLSVTDDRALPGAEEASQAYAREQPHQRQGGRREAFVHRDDDVDRREEEHDGQKT